jgi:flagellar hook-length control protein FliK
MAVDVPLGRAQAETTQQTVGLPLMGTPLMDEARSADFTMTMVETGRKLAAHSTATPIKAMPVTGTTNPAGVPLEGMPEASPTRTAPAGSDWLGLTDRLQFADVTDRPSTKEAKLEALTDRAAVMPATSTALKTDLISGSQRVMDAGTRVSTVEPQQFGNEMATHVRVLKSQSGGEVKLNLHPAELGRMSISVSTEGNETRVAFVVETSQARQAVEAALPRLRDMLENAGLSLSDSDVSEQRNPQSDLGDKGPGSSRGDSTSPDGDDVSATTVLSLTVDPDRLVDTYI